MMVGARSNQEDCIFDGTMVFQADFLTRKNQFESQRVAFAVCDGMGGHNAGELASRFVCERIEQADWEEPIASDRIHGMLSGIQMASMEHLPENCGTTVAGLIAANDRAIIFNAGDTRVYQLNADAIDYVSHDHTRIQEMVDQSIIDAASAITHPQRNLIEFGIGPVFIHAWSGRKSFVRELVMNRPACYLLCSDGLTDLMPAERIQQLLQPDPITYGPRLYNALRQMELRDNTSFIIAELT